MTLRPAVELTTLTLHIPVRFKRRGGRKLILAPDGVASPVSPRPAVDDTMLKLLIKAHAWRRRIERKRSKSITNLAGKCSIYYQCVILLELWLTFLVIFSVLTRDSPGVC